MDIVISILTFLINLCLIAAVWGVYRKTQSDKVELYAYFKSRNLDYHKVYRGSIKRTYKKFSGLSEKAIRDAAIAEKFAERAFTLASSANVGLVALQKSLATPKIITAQQSIKNQLAKKQVDEIFQTNSGFDYLRPLLSDEDNDILDSIEAQKLKAANKMNGAV